MTGTGDMPPRRARSGLALFLWLAGGLVLGRFAILYVLDHELRGQDRGYTLWRMAHEAFLPLLHGLAAAGAVAWIASARAKARERSGSPRAADLAAAAVAALFLFSALSGWPLDDALHVPSFSTGRGRGFAAAMLGVSAVAAAAALAFARRARAGGALGGALASRASIAGAVALLVVPVVLLVSLYGLSAPRARVLEVVREVGLEPSAWRTLRQHPRRAPEPGMLSPLPDDWRLDGGDLPALVMPPPCTIEFEVEQSDGPVILRAAAGVDARGYERLVRGEPDLTVRFELRVNGETRFTHDALLAREQALGDRQWSRVGGRDGLELVPGDRVTLSTDVVDPVFEAPGRVPVLPAGFGDLRLERERVKGRERARPDAPNIVLIVMDTLRQDRLSCYGRAGETTPNLDRLAARGTLFENACATSSWTWPSTASVLTGLPPETHGVEADGACYLRSTFELLPELLSARSYVTGSFTCNPLIVPNKGFAQGSDMFESQAGFRNSENMIAMPLEWLDMQAGSRFFLYLHLVDPHAPYRPIPEYLDGIAARRPADFPEKGVNAYVPELLAGANRDEQGNPIPGAVIPDEHLAWLDLVYDGAVRTADHFIGMVLDRIAELGLEDRTVIAFTSDHGEEFLEHGLATHGNTVHRELVDVPLILAGPGIPAGRRVSTPVSNRHLAPTLAKFGNARFSGLTDGIDLSLADEIPAQPVYFSTHQGWWNGHHRLVIHGVREGDWVLHWAPKGAPWGVDPSEQVDPNQQQGGDFRLYDRASDPGELHDVKALHPEVAERLLQTLKAYLDEARRGKPALQIGVGGQGLKMLKDIGYIQSED